MRLNGLCAEFKLAAGCLEQFRQRTRTATHDLFPSPRQTGRGSGRGVRFLFQFNFPQIRRNKFLFPGVLHYPNAARPSLQSVPNFQQTSLAILLPLMVPEPEGFDALLRQKFFAGFVPLNSSRQAVLKAVQFDIQLRVCAVKIQDMSAKCVLPAKFEAGELASSQCLPKFFFLVCLRATKIAGDLFEAHAGRMRIVGKNSSSSPRPSPR